MLLLKAIQTSFIPNSHALFHGKKECFRRKGPNLIFCKSSDSKSSPPPEGDMRKQELLAQIAMLQAEKLRLTDYLDEKSSYLTQFAEEANSELDQIGENALKELDEACAGIMEKLDSRMRAFEESAESNKQEIRENEKKLAEFEGQIARDRNEGLFFKNLRQKKPAEKAKAMEEVEKLKELTKKNAGSTARRNIYVGLVGLVVLKISDNLISSSSDWRKAAVLGVILAGLLAQLFYEQKMLSEREKTEQQKTKVDRE